MFVTVAFTPQSIVDAAIAGLSRGSLMQSIWAGIMHIRMAKSILFNTRDYVSSLGRQYRHHSSLFSVFYVKFDFIFYTI